MTRRLWLRIGIVAVVVVLSIFYLYPPKKTINLGLDLQGGIHLVLGVDIDKAFQTQVERVIPRWLAWLDIGERGRGRSSAPSPSSPTSN